MTTVFTKDYLRKALSLALQSVNSQFDQLNALDAATGDGDHGTAIVSTLQAAVKASEAEASLKDMLSNIAMEIMSATGGSTSSLYGSFFMGMSDGATSEALDPAQTVAMFQSGLTMMQTMTTAKVGDKTMMDAMLPATSALTETLQSNSGATLAELFGAAAKAAKEGAERTVDYIAKFGRAKNLGERSRGSQDAGATSLALVFQAFADAL
ncbi:MAG: dihydroxyacetone kinase subunit L [Planctomycetia bacterium]|nr:dihydroxyacetone kinase subunit L [Planctomycetia bacterium]